MSGKLDRAIAESERESQSQELAAEMFAMERRALSEQIPLYGQNSEPQSG